MLTAAIQLQPQIVPNWFVVAMGIGTVFVGLICIVILCMVTSLFFRGKSENKTEKKDTATVSTPVTTTSAPIENRQEIIAAVTAAVAEEMGTDVSALRVVSFKKL